MRHERRVFMTPLRLLGSLEDAKDAAQLASAPAGRDWRPRRWRESWAALRPPCGRWPARRGSRSSASPAACLGGFDGLLEI
jgi:hypothetical protein